MTADLSGKTCVVHDAPVWSDVASAAGTWLRSFLAGWRSAGGAVVAATSLPTNPEWADALLRIDDTLPVGPAPLAAGARLHAALRSDQRSAGADVIVLADGDAGWAVLEARRGGLAHGGSVVVAVVAGPRQRTRTERLDRALDLHAALAERIDDHLLENADLIVTIDEQVSAWCAPRCGPHTEVVDAADVDAALDAVRRASGELVGRFDAVAGASPTVTAVVTHFNRPDMVRRAVDSLLVQTWPALDIIVVDDGSTHPHAAATLDEFATRQFNRPVTVVRKANGGLGSARNEGLRRASGEFVVFLDDDDEAEPTYVERMATALQVTGAAASVVGFRVMQQADAGPLDGLDEQLQWMYFSPAFDLAVLDNVVGGAAAMFRKDAALAVGGFHEFKHLTYEDWALLVKLALAGEDIVPVPEALLRYRVSPTSMLRTFPLWGSRDQVFDAYRSKLPEALQQWPALVYGLHERAGQLAGERDRAVSELDELRNQLHRAGAELDELRAIAAHRDAMLASRSWQLGSFATSGLRSLRRAVGRVVR